jgi:hypothetical protein
MGRWNALDGVYIKSACGVKRVSVYGDWVADDAVEFVLLTVHADSFAPEALMRRGCGLGLESYAYALAACSELLRIYYSGLF